MWRRRVAILRTPYEDLLDVVIVVGLSLPIGIPFLCALLAGR